MEDRVVEFNFLDAVYNGTCGIGDTASDQPEYTLGWEAVDQRFYRKNDDPAHEHVHQGG